MAGRTKRPGRKSKDPLKLRRDKAGRILKTAERTGDAAKRQAQAQRFRQLGADGVLDPRLGSTLGMMFVLGVPVRISAPEYDAASWLADRLRAHDEIVLALRRSPPSNAIERGTGGTKLSPLEIEASERKGRLEPGATPIDQAARDMLDQVKHIRDAIDGAEAAMGGGAIGRLRWEALRAGCRGEGLSTAHQLRHFVEALVELAWAGGYYEEKRRQSKNTRAAWGHDVAAVEIIRIVQGRDKPTSASPATPPTDSE